MKTFASNQFQSYVVWITRTKEWETEHNKQEGTSLWNAAQESQLHWHLVSVLIFFDSFASMLFGKPVPVLALDAYLYWFFGFKLFYWF